MGEPIATTSPTAIAGKSGEHAKPFEWKLTIEKIPPGPAGHPLASRDDLSFFLESVSFTGFDIETESSPIGEYATGLAEGSVMTTFTDNVQREVSGFFDEWSKRIIRNRDSMQSRAVVRPLKEYIGRIRIQYLDRRTGTDEMDVPFTFASIRAWPTGEEERDQSYGDTGKDNLVINWSVFKMIRAD